jgi:hypothetical protein
MVVIVIIRNMNFLPIMKTGMPRPAAPAARRSLMRNRAGKSRCDAVRPYFCGWKTISDFGGDRALLDGQ